MANSVDPDQTAPRSSLFWSTLFASLLNSSVMFSNYLQQTTSAYDIFRCNFFLCALRVKQGQRMFVTDRQAHRQTDMQVGRSADIFCCLSSQLSVLSYFFYPEVQRL